MTSRAINFFLILIKFRNVWKIHKTWPFAVGFADCCTQSKGTTANVSIKIFVELFFIEREAWNLTRSSFYVVTEQPQATENSETVVFKNNFTPTESPDYWKLHQSSSLKFMLRLIPLRFHSLWTSFCHFLNLNYHGAAMYINHFPCQVVYRMAKVTVHNVQRSVFASRR